MNRQTKYRAWNPDENKIENNFLIDNEGCIFTFNLIDGMYPREKWVLMQHAGLKDKKGKGIYEGDIRREEIEYDEGDDTQWYVCVYITEWSRFAWLNACGEYPEYLESGIEHLDHSMQETFGVFANESDKTTICGNIFENPELIKNA